MIPPRGMPGAQPVLCAVALRASHGWKSTSVSRDREGPSERIASQGGVESVSDNMDGISRFASPAYLVYCSPTAEVLAPLSKTNH
jgi:hypothetical protein